MRDIHTQQYTNEKTKQNNDDQRLGVNVKHFGLLLVPFQEPGIDLYHIRKR